MHNPGLVSLVNVRRVMLGAAFVMLASLSAHAAQGDSAASPVAPTPRLPDGTPNLGRVEPGKGQWMPQQSRDYTAILLDPPNGIPYKPWARAVKDYRWDVRRSRDDPEGFCLPPGVPRAMTTPYPVEILQLPERIIMIYEGGAHIFRVIYMDGRPHPQSALEQPSWTGHSVGHWEGDTLVVDVVGLNEGTWIDANGHPHTEKLHVTERYSRPDLMTLRYEATMDDPGAYTGEWTVGYNIRWNPEGEIREYICQENNRWQERYVLETGNTGNVGADTGQGHPVKGVWLGDWGPDATRRTDVVVQIGWDGEAITGTINPGQDDAMFTAADLDLADWTLHVEAEAGAVRYVIDGQLENPTWLDRTLVGTWIQGDQRGDFTLTRQK